MKRTNNDATRFILPMLYHIDISKNRLFRYNDDFFITNNFINCFIGDYSKTEYKAYTILLAYEIEKSFEFEQLEDNMSRHPLYLDDYIIRGSYGSLTVVYVFKVPLEYYVDFNLIKGGWYSKISNRMKNQILDFWRLKGDNLIHSILYTTEMILNYMKGLNELDNLKQNSNLGECWYKFKYRDNSLFY